MKTICQLLFLLISCYKCYSQKSETSVWFNFDKYSLTAQAKVSLDSFVNTITKGENFKITIKGYTDDIGTVDYNTKLAARRAKTVADYLKSKSIDSLKLFFGDNEDVLFTKNVQNWLKRKTTIEIIRYPTKPFSFFGQLGTEVQSFNNYPISVKEYFSSESMLRDSVYAISTNNEIIVTAGMINICQYRDTIDKEGNLLIKIPIQTRGIDTAMKVWNEERTTNGQLRWKQSSISLNIDSTRKYYVFKIPAGSKTCMFFNLDKYCFNSCLAYITTYKPFNFKDVSLLPTNNPVQSLPFQAKPNDSTWVFYKGDLAELKDFYFNGKIALKNIDTFITASLKNCKFTLDDKNNHHYFICDTCFDKKVITIADKNTETKEVKEIKKTEKKTKRNFFQRIIDLFKKNK